MSYYETLGLNKNANDTEIKKAYRSLSLKYHPDRPDGDVEKFKSINEAYEVLSDPVKKREYDYEDSPVSEDIDQVFSHFFQGGMGGRGIRIFHNGGGGGIPPGFPVDIFGEMMSTGNPFLSQFIKPPTIQCFVNITLEQAYYGCVSPIQYSRFIVRGNNRQDTIVNTSVQIHEGIDHENVIVLENQGNDVNGATGDVRIIVQITNNTQFERQDLNLLLHKTITLKESLCGFTFEVSLITGSALTIRNTGTKIIRPGFRQTCHGHGLKRGEKTGDLLIEFSIQFPESLTHEQQTVLKDLLP